ncbi:phage-like protein [Yersinia pekkanenii]|uniref:Phage-like protein n=1 Tax=Yersinia pekkanenii TaxID=1288385 RepID=A0ABM9TNL6_9GAMM|nr:hypothetical protein [Yersinia pekkanenii]CRY65713.1 phage-like protein [Yersinia pekkanenii]
MTVDGSWQRDTDQAIEETSRRRSVTSDEENRTTTTRTTTVKANDSTTVLGTKTLMAGQVVQLAEGDYSIGTSASMVTKVGKDRNDDVGQNQNITVGHNQNVTAGQSQTTDVGAHSLRKSPVFVAVLPLLRSLSHPRFAWVPTISTC